MTFTTTLEAAMREHVEWITPFIESANQMSRDTGWGLDEWQANHGWNGVAVLPWGQTRDSEALERSNFRVILDSLRESHPKHVDTVTFSHWGHGWVQFITWDPTVPELVEAVQAWESAMADYPAASDSDLSELESEERDEALMSYPYNVAREHVRAVARWLFANRDVCRRDELLEADVKAAMATVPHAFDAGWSDVHVCLECNTHRFKAVHRSV